MTNGESDLRVTFGTKTRAVSKFGTPVPTGAQLRFVEQIILHPEYVDETNQNDIALLKLDATVTFAANIRPICLQSPPLNGNTADHSLDEVYTNCWQAGWGRIATSGSRKWYNRIRFLS